MSDRKCFECRNPQNLWLECGDALGLRIEDR